MIHTDLTVPMIPGLPEEIDKGNVSFGAGSRGEVLKALAPGLGVR